MESGARIVLEKALATPVARAALGEAAAARCQELLDERTRCFLALNTEEVNMEWFSGAQWLEMTAQLYAAAAAVSSLPPGAAP